MYSRVKKAVLYTNTTLITILLCATAAQANVYEVSKPILGVPTGVNTRAAYAQAQSPVREQPWLSPARASTTLSLTGAGLAPLALLTAYPGFDSGVATALSLAPIPTTSAAAVPSTGQDRLATASIPASAVPAASSAVGGQTIRQDLPLFGAHRIRFGKIRSGARISGLVREAAATGSSAICINQCAVLADRLALRNASVGEQLRHVSSAVNAMVAYRTDDENHGRLDQWSTPNETLSRGSGDCEDYAILKMALLARLGVPMSAMEIVVVKDTSRRLFHAILSVSIGGKGLILDNMTDAVEPDSAKRSYAPLFSISGAANYVFGYKGGKSSLVASVGDIMTAAPGAGF